MRIILNGRGVLTLELNEHELEAQIKLLKMFKVEDKDHALQMDQVLTVLQLYRCSKK